MNANEEPNSDEELLEMYKELWALREKNSARKRSEALELQKKVSSIADELLMNVETVEKIGGAITQNAPEILSDKETASNSFKVGSKESVSNLVNLKNNTTNIIANYEKYQIGQPLPEELSFASYSKDLYSYSSELSEIQSCISTLRDVVGKFRKVILDSNEVSTDNIIPDETVVSKATSSLTDFSSDENLVASSPNPR